jgi:hypothetical protein
VAATNRLVRLLRDTRATDADCRKLVEGLSDLDLNGRTLGLYGAQKLVRILKGMTWLTSLGLSGSLCELGDEVAGDFLKDRGWC